MCSWNWRTTRLKTLLKVQFAALKASLFRSRRKQAKGGTGRTIGFAVLFLYVIICFFIMFGSMFSSICMPLHELGLGWLYFATVLLMIGIVFLILKPFIKRLNENS